jgi:diguanylate cyclase (GGDEF)-like protein
MHTGPERDEERRLEGLRAYAVLDSEPEPAFDRLTSLAARLFDTPMALISLTDASRQWFKSRLGMPLREVAREGAFCAVAMAQERPLVVRDALLDPRFARAPLVVGAPHARFYAGAPLITPHGVRLGALGVLDSSPRTPSEGELATLMDLAGLVVDQLELRKLSRDLDRRSEDARELKQTRAKLERLASTDPLTGLANQRALRERLEALVDEATHGRKFALILADVDHFKRVNDSLGPLGGDDVLRRVASALGSHVRATDLVARYGGEEFCILLTDLEAEAAAAVADELRRVVAALELPVRVTASFGVCAPVLSTPAAGQAEALIAGADRALCRAKQAGRNRVELELPSLARAG